MNQYTDHPKMKRLRDTSIKTKLTLLLAVAAGSALLLACIAFGINDLYTLRNSTVQHLTAVTDVVGANAAAAVTFNDADVASEVLSSLKLESIVRFACVYDREGKPFATFQQQGGEERTEEPPQLGEEGYEFTSNGTLEIFAPISDGQEQVGTVYVQAGMEYLDARIQQHVLMAFLVGLVSLVASLVVSSRLQNIISVPILRLADITDQISKEGNYAVRVRKIAGDEIGLLYDGFNRMVQQMEQSEHDLRQARDELEARVVERTKQLSKTNEELSREVAERERAEQELRALQAEHIEAARRGGMAEIATSVLHNVGNVLNSVNVSTTTIAGKVRRSGVTDFAKAAELIEQHPDDLGSFVTEDERGRHLPQFLIELSRKMATDEEAILEEVSSLSKNIQHIKEIVSLQQSHAGISGLIEEVALPELVDDAIRINSISFSRHDIDINREYEDLPPVAIDKQKFLQLLVNLLGNAKHAVVDADQPDGQITARIAKSGEMVRVEIIDNGVGILSENRTRIFQRGFTTRKNGHGFGLHSAALSAKEMGGKLTVDSDGPGTGATFVLEVPFSNAGVAK